MNINRDNYETFFLLYTDNELSASERKAVDTFVIANPDLLEELEMLQQSVLLPANIIFDFKQTLLKTEVISSELQEKLLQHLDNELSASEKNEVEALIKKEVEIKKEWDELQLVKLEADETIVFDNKESLYRKESGRVVAFQWRKLAAAAVLIGFGLWGAIQYLKNDPKTNTSELATNGNKETPVGNDLQSTKRVIAYDTASSLKQEPITATKVETMPAPSMVESTTKTESTKTYRGNAAENNEKATLLAVQPKDNNLPKPYSEILNNTSGNNSIIATVTPLKQPTTTIDPVQKVVTNSTFTQDAAKEYVSVASFTENSEESSNHVLFMDEEKVKKTKIGGFFRKVKRVVERTTNFKTGGNNFKVANLEFTIQ